MTKTTASRRILLILVVTLIAAAGLVFEVVAANPVYADVREIELEKTEDSDLWSDSDLTFIVDWEGLDFYNIAIFGNYIVNMAILLNFYFSFIKFLIKDF